ncbi:MAG: exodeoxyribonuclease VII large subunit [Okeania sp. SIO2D1]|nr:exodeoxyribonuclease VII large subunit [Okeania sp. SIO2D1]
MNLPGFIPPTTLSVARLNSYIKDLLELDEHLSQVWVTGEVSSSKNHYKGIFFTLTDTDGSAAIKCVVWGNLRNKLVQQPQRGEQVTVLASIRVYPKRGEYQLNVVQILPAGEGLQALRFQQLRDRLTAEGLFAPEMKLPLPYLPRTIAVVTSPTAAAWGDIQRSIKQRYRGLLVLFSPAIVQGEEAPASIVEAIARVERDNRAEVIILARGGGAVEDLACFNDERVVRAIAVCSIPVITGIGHQQDESLADLVADDTAHTPTAAVEIAVPDYRQMLAQHQERKKRLVELVNRRWQQEEKKLQSLKTQLQQLPSTSRSLTEATSHLNILRQKLNALDPQAVLARGYALVRHSTGILIRSEEEVELGEELTVSLNQGEIRVKVIPTKSSLDQPNYEL